MNKFAKWVKDNGMKQMVIAKKLGISQATLHAILQKGLEPRLKVAIAIQKLTKEEVTVYDWNDQRTLNASKPKIKMTATKNKIEK